MDEEKINREAVFPEDELSPKRISWGWKLIAGLLLLAFIAFSFPNISYLWSGDLDFLQENQMLTEDEIVQNCSPAVVSIKAISSKGLVSRGSGFNLDVDGLVISNYHVVSQAKQVEMEFSDGQVFLSQDIERIKDIDIALIYFEGKDLPALQVDWDKIAQRGETVTVIGNPLGFERISGRGTVGGYHQIKDEEMVFFDIAVTAKSGSSGSPVINKDGQAVGIVFATGEVEIDGKKEERALAIPLYLVKALKAELSDKTTDNQ